MLTISSELLLSRPLFWDDFYGTKTFAKPLLTTSFAMSPAGWISLPKILPLYGSYPTITTPTVLLSNKLSECNFPWAEILGSTLLAIGWMYGRFILRIASKYFK